MRISTITVAASAIALALSACASPTSPPAPDQVQETSDAQVQESVGASWPVTIETAQLPLVDYAAAPVDSTQSVLALAVGSGEIVDLLGAGDQLVGKDETSSTTQDVPTVTRAHQIDIEQALSLQPNVVLVDDLTGPPEAIEALSSAGARIVDVPSVWSLADIATRVETIAQAIGAPTDSAQELSDALTQTGDSANTAPPRVAFLYLRGPSSIYLLGGANTGADALIEAAGGVDVGAELGYDGFVPLTAEANVEADPDVLLVMSDGLDSVGGIDGLLELPGVAQTRAGDSKHVVVVDDQVLLSFGARTPALIDRLKEVFAEAAA